MSRQVFKVYDEAAPLSAEIYLSRAAIKYFERVADWNDRIAVHLLDGTRVVVQASFGEFCLAFLPLLEVAVKCDDGSVRHVVTTSHAVAMVRDDGVRRTITFVDGTSLDIVPDAPLDTYFGSSQPATPHPA